MPLVEATGISKFFGGLAALSQVDVHIDKGELVGLIGPNGAGKSTLVNVLSGYYGPTSGKILLDGVDVTGKKLHEVARKGIVRSFQQSFIFKEFTVLENAIIGHHIFERPGFFEGLFYTAGYRRKETEYAKKAEEVLEFAGLAPYKSEKAGGLPYGYQRLLGIAIAVSADPKVLLLDEPVAGMNPQEIRQTLELVRQVRQERQLGILLIEHNVRAIMEHCQRIIVLNFGKKIAEGTPQQVGTDRAVIDAYLGEETHAS